MEKHKRLNRYRVFVQIFGNYLKENRFIQGKYAFYRLNGPIIQSISIGCRAPLIRVDYGIYAFCDTQLIPGVVQTPNNTIRKVNGDPATEGLVALDVEKAIEHMQTMLLMTQNSLMPFFDYINSYERLVNYRLENFFDRFAMTVAYPRTRALLYARYANEDIIQDVDSFMRSKGDEIEKLWTKVLQMRAQKDFSYIDAQIEQFEYENIEKLKNEGVTFPNSQLKGLHCAHRLGDLRES